MTEWREIIKAKNDKAEVQSWQLWKYAAKGGYSKNSLSIHTPEYKWYCLYMYITAPLIEEKMFWYYEGTKRIDRMTKKQRELLSIIERERKDITVNMIKSSGYGL